MSFLSLFETFKKKSGDLPCEMSLDTCSALKNSSIFDLITKVFEINEGVHGQRAQVTSDRLLYSHAKLCCDPL